MTNGMMVVLNAVSNDSRVVKMGVAMSRVFSNFVLIGMFPAGQSHVKPIVEEISGLRCVKFPHYKFPLEAQAGEDKAALAFRQSRTALERLRDDIARYAGEFRPDVLHTHDMYTMPIGALAKREAAKAGRTMKWIHDVHEFAAGSHHMPPARQQYALSIEREFLHDADEVITVTPQLAEELQALYPDLRPVRVIHNTPEMHPAPSPPQGTLREALGIGAAPLAVYSGVVKPMRGAERMIPVLQRMPELHFALLTGSKSAFTEQLVAQARAAGVDDRLHWHPYVAPSAVVGFLKGADVGVIPIENYGNAEVALPNKLFEYTFAELPIVTHQLKALTEFTREWNVGKVVDFADPEAAAAAIRTCLAPRERAAFTRAHSDLVRRFSWEVQSRTLMTLYRDLQGKDGAELVDPVSGVDLPEGDLKILHGISGAAGQPGTLARFLDRIDGISARSLQVSRSIYGYPSDLVYPMVPGVGSVVNAAHLLKSVGKDFDVFHLHYRGFFHDPKSLAFPVLMDLLALKAAGKIVVMHFRGSEARLQSVFREKSPFHYVDEDEEGTVAAFPEREKRRFIELVGAVADAVFVTDPELASYVPGARIVERAIDLSVWTDVGVGDTDCPLIVHAPSRRGVKGTRSIINAVGNLRKEGLRFDFQIVENLPQAQARAIYERADIIVDQLRIGWHGVLAVEGMALGKPVVSYIRDDLLHHMGEEPPLAVANPTTIETVLRRLILSPGTRADLGRRGRAYVERVHDAEIVAAKLAGLYREMSAAPRPIDLNPVIDHLVYQHALAKAPPPPSLTLPSKNKIKKKPPARTEQEAQGPRARANGSAGVNRPRAKPYERQGAARGERWLNPRYTNRQRAGHLLSIYREKSIGEAMRFVLHRLSARRFRGS